MRFKAAIVGDLEKVVSGDLNRAETAVTHGVRAAAKDLQEDFRGAVRAARLGRGLEKAWRVEHYPRTGKSLKAASTVYSKARLLHAAFSETQVIRAKRARWLAIPLPAAVKLGLHKSWRGNERGTWNKRWSNVEAAIGRFGAVRYVKIKPGKVLVVADNLTAGLRRSKTRRTRQGAEYSSLRGRRVSAPLFLLVRSVRVSKRLDMDRFLRKAHDRMIPEIIRRWKDTS